MLKNFFLYILIPFNSIKNRGVKISFLFLAAVFGLSACNWTTGVFEKNLTFDNHVWPSSLKPDIAFDITDTVSTYNIPIIFISYSDIPTPIISIIFTSAQPSRSREIRKAELVTMTCNSQPTIRDGSVRPWMIFMMRVFLFSQKPGSANQALTISLWSS
jgi:hypothetical protein